MYKDQIREVLRQTTGDEQRVEQRVELLNKLITKQVVHNLNADVPSRLAALLLSFQEGGSCMHDGRGFDVRITQGEMARRVGASRSYVSTLINDWKLDRIITAYGRTLCIVDVAALKRWL